MNDTPTHHDPDSSDSQHPLPKLAHLPTKLLIFLVLYLLGIGPAAHLETLAPSLGPVIGVLYYPLQAVCTYFPPAAYALLWYLAFVWRVPIDA